MQRAVAGTQPATLEDYQPFDKNTTSGSGGSAGFTAPPPTTNSVPPPSYPSTTQPQISAADFEVLHAYIICIEIMFNELFHLLKIHRFSLSFLPGVKGRKI